MLRQLGILARMVKIEHSVFALPYAYAGSFMAADGWPGWRAFLLITIAMVSVRSFAMAYNRLADLDIDSKNPRTSNRPLVTGEISPNATRLFILLNAVVFVLACASMNSMALALSPVALGIAAVYSLTKRFTMLCHFVLGATLSFAPLGGWIAVSPEFTLPAVLMAIGVMFWVAGFDLLYACQDAEFDRGMKLHSIPAKLGIGTSLVISTFCHVNTAIFFLLTGWAAGLGAWYTCTMLVISGLLVYQHTLVKEDDLSRVNLAFFTLNGIIGLFVFLGLLADIYL